MNTLHFREFVENPHQEIVTGDPTIEFEEISKKLQNPSPIEIF